MYIVTGATPAEGATIRATPAEASLLASIESGDDEGRIFLNEAHPTLKIRKVLGVKSNRKEFEALNKIVQLEEKDKQRIGRGNKAIA